MAKSTEKKALKKGKATFNLIGRAKVTDKTFNLDNSYDSGFGKVKLATSTAIDAYKLLFEDDKSPYFIKENQDTNMFNVYNAFTQIITDNRKKEIINNCEKTLLLKDILNFDIN